MGFGIGRKHCGKRRNCSSHAISPFSTAFLKNLVLQTRENKGLLGEGLKKYKNYLGYYLSQTSPCFYMSAVEVF